jgi:hypothetical protein
MDFVRLMQTQRWITYLCVILLFTNLSLGALTSSFDSSGETVFFTSR